MCSKPVQKVVQKVGNAVTQAAKDVGSAVERNVSVPIKNTADNIGKGFENTISENVKKAANDTGSWFEGAVSKPTGTFFNNADNWFDVKMPGLNAPTEGDSSSADGPGATSVEGLLAKRRRKLTNLQSGLFSTIATSPLGLSGASSSSAPSAGGLKDKLGA